MNIETGELRQFQTADELADFMKSLSSHEQEKWAEVDSSKLTTKQIKKMQIEPNDHRSPTAIERDLLRKKRRAKKLQEKRDAIKNIL